MDMFRYFTVTVLIRWYQDSQPLIAQVLIDQSMSVVPSLSSNMVLSTFRFVTLKNQSISPPYCIISLVSIPPVCCCPLQPAESGENLLSCAVNHYHSFSPLDAEAVQIAVKEEVGSLQPFFSQIRKIAPNHIQTQSSSVLKLLAGQKPLHALARQPRGARPGLGRTFSKKHHFY